MAAQRHVESLETPDPEPISRRSVLLRRAGLIAGVLLLSAALVMVWRKHEIITGALESIQQLSTVRLICYPAILTGSVAISIVLSGAVFSLLISRYGKVGVLEMQALMAASTLLNFVPLSPGLFGRIAYHRAVHDISAINSAKTVLQATVLSAVATLYVAGATFLSLRLDWSIWPLALAPIPALAAVGVAVLTVNSFRPIRIWPWAGLFRYLEVIATAGRYYAAFALIGSPIAPSSALALACVSMVARLVPFFSNGLGLREWAIGLLSPLLAEHQVGLGITADLLNRAAELLVVLALGLAGIAWLTHHRRARPASAER